MISDGEVRRLRYNQSLRVHVSNGLKVVPIGTSGPKYILFGYMNP